VRAFAQLNNQGLGRFADFRNMHTQVSSPQAHGAPGFLPWHRAYLLDLERELQAIDPSVALPYWRFDQAAPTSLRSISSAPPIRSAPSSSARPPVAVLEDRRRAGDQSPALVQHRHGAAGPAHRGADAGAGHPIFRIPDPGNQSARNGAYQLRRFYFQHPTAAKDPLFFLLHCNVDRMWAKWQRQNGRFNPALAASFDNSGGNPIGHNLPDTMWPWNGITGGSRPPTAPGGAMATSPCVGAPGPQPRVRDCLDFQGAISAPARMGFDYDDVTFA